MGLATLIFDATVNNDVNRLETLIKNAKTPIRKHVNDTTALHSSSEKGCLGTTSVLLSHGWHPNMRDERGNAALHVTRSEGIALLLLNAGANPSLKNQDAQTPLATALINNETKLATLLLDHSPTEAINEAIHIAALLGNEKLLRFMKKKGYDLNVRLTDGAATPLHAVASVDGDVSLLLEPGEDVDPLDCHGASPLHWAAVSGSLKAARALVTAGAEVNRIDTTQGGTPLGAAIQSKNSELVEFLIAKGADVHRREMGGRPKLHLAAQNGSPQIVKCLLQAGLEVSNLDELGGTAARWAAQNGHVETLKTLCSFGCNALKSDNHGWTPLHAAASGGHIDTVIYLLDTGASPNSQSLRGDTPLLCAITGKHPEVFGILLDRGGKFSVMLIKLVITEDDHESLEKILLRREICPDFANHLLEDDATDLAFAIEKGRYQIARTMIMAGFSVDQLSYDHRTDMMFFAIEECYPDIVRKLAGVQTDFSFKRKESLMTPIHVAAEVGNVDILKLLIDLGFCISDETECGQTGLHYAARGGHLDAARLLMGSISVQLRDINGRTPLHWAVENAHGGMVRLLSKEVGSVSVTDINKHTALHIACQEGLPECVKVLLEAGSDPSAADATLRTPLHLAAGSKSKEATEVVRLIMEHGGGDLEARNLVGATPLGYSVSSGNVDLVKYLITQSADPESRDGQNRIPIYHALMMGHVNVVKFLLQLKCPLYKEPRCIAELWHYASYGAKLELFELLARKTIIGVLPPKTVIEVFTETINSADDDTCAYLLDLIMPSTLCLTKEIAIRALMISAKRGLYDTSEKLARISGIGDMLHLSASPLQSALLSNNKDIAAMLLRHGFTAADTTLLDQSAKMSVESINDDSSGWETINDDDSD